MLVQFRVENHRSLRDEQTLSMVAANVGAEDDPRLIRALGVKDALLPGVAIYGANASGKSNVVRALAFMRSAVLQSHRLWVPDGGTHQEPFALSSKVSEPSLYEVDILLDGARFRYGFVISAAKVEEEWLYAWKNGRRQVWFEREGERFDFGKKLAGENRAIADLARSNSLFVSAAAQNNHAMLAPLFHWFARRCTTLSQGPYPRRPSQTFLSNLADAHRGSVEAFLMSDDDRRRHREAVVRLLRASDIGIVDIGIVEHDRLSASAARPKSFEMRLRHQAEEGAGEKWLPLSVESAGTQTLLWIAAGLFDVLGNGGVLCIDELEASLHPMLALEIIRLFNDPKQNPRGAQIIFTTHDTNLLGNVVGEPPLRRDQVWFTEKDKTGATHLYPLTDFHPRDEENLERGYLQGRYGAIPFLGQLVPPLDGAGCLRCG